MEYDVETTSTIWWFTATRPSEIWVSPLGVPIKERLMIGGLSFIGWSEEIGDPSPYEKSLGGGECRGTYNEMIKRLCNERTLTPNPRSNDPEPVFFFAVRSLLLLGRLKTSQADG